MEEDMDEDTDLDDLMQQMRMEKNEPEHCRTFMRFLCLHHREGIDTVRKVTRLLLEECNEDVSSSLVMVCVEMLPLIANLDEESLDNVLDCYAHLLSTFSELTGKVLEGLAKIDIPKRRRLQMIEYASMSLESMSEQQTAKIFPSFLSILDEATFRVGATHISQWARKSSRRILLLDAFGDAFEFDTKSCTMWIEYCRKLPRLTSFEVSTLLRSLGWANVHVLAQVVLLSAIQNHAVDYSAFHQAIEDHPDSEFFNVLKFWRHSLNAGPRNLAEWWNDILPSQLKENEALQRFVAIQLLEISSVDISNQEQISQCIGSLQASTERYETVAASILLLQILDAGRKHLTPMFDILIQHLEKMALHWQPTVTQTICKSLGILSYGLETNQEKLLKHTRKLLLHPSVGCYVAGSLLAAQYIRSFQDLKSSRVHALVRWVAEAAEVQLQQDKAYLGCLTFMTEIFDCIRPADLEEIACKHVDRILNKISLQLLTSMEADSTAAECNTFLYPRAGSCGLFWGLSHHTSLLACDLEGGHAYPSGLLSVAVQCKMKTLHCGDSGASHAKIYDVIAHSGLALSNPFCMILSRATTQLSPREIRPLLLECDLAIELIVCLTNMFWDLYVVTGLDFEVDALISRVSQFEELCQARKALGGPSEGFPNLEGMEGRNGCTKLDSIYPEVWYFLGRRICLPRTLGEECDENLVHDVVKHCAGGIAKDMAAFFHHVEPATRGTNACQQPFCALEALLESNLLPIALEWSDVMIRSQAQGKSSVTVCRFLWILYASISSAQSKSHAKLVEVLGNIQGSGDPFSSNPANNFALVESFSTNLEELLLLVQSLPIAVIILELAALFSVSNVEKTRTKLASCLCSKKYLLSSPEEFQIVRTILPAESVSDLFGRIVEMCLIDERPRKRSETADKAFAALWNGLSIRESFPSWLAPAARKEEWPSLQQREVWVSTFTAVLHFVSGQMNEKLRRKDARHLTSNVTESSLNVYRLLQLHKHAGFRGFVDIRVSSDLMGRLAIILRALGKKIKCIHTLSNSKPVDKNVGLPSFLPEACTMVHLLLKACHEFATAFLGSVEPADEGSSARVSDLGREYSYVISHLSRLASSIDAPLEQLPAISTSRWRKDRCTSISFPDGILKPGTPAFLEDGLEPSDAEDSDWASEGGPEGYFIAQTGSLASE